MKTYYSIAVDRQSEPVAAASQRLITAAGRPKKRMNRDAYYGDGHEEPPSPPDEKDQIAGTLITRNHYGSLVLNASRALFIDVDVSEFAVPCVPDSADNWDARWQSTLDDLRTVLAHEKDDGFRIYRTAAGFRVLATTREFEPSTPASSGLMAAVGADADFVKLCRIQNNFRARLTPKPWRCGMRRPPGLLPCRTEEERSQFAHWLANYERACAERATCRFLEHVGLASPHPQVAPVVALHDRLTKAFQDLQLA
jgi:hypothetical protein